MASFAFEVETFGIFSRRSNSTCFEIIKQEAQSDCDISRQSGAENIN